MKYNTFFYREQDILEWGYTRNIVGTNGQSSAAGQFLKTTKEFDEWKEKHEADDVGDIFVTLVMVTSYMGLSVGDVFGVLGTHRTLGHIDLSEVRDSVKAIGLDDTFEHILGLLKQDIEEKDVDTFKVNVFVLVNLLFEMAKSIDKDLFDCIDTAWEDIRYRQGKMVHSIYIKQSDLDFLEANDIKYTELYGDPCFCITNPFAVAGIDKLTKDIGFTIKDNRTTGFQK